MAKTKQITDAKFRALCKKGWNNAEIAEVTGHSRESVRQRREKLGIEPSPKGIRRASLQTETVVGRLQAMKTADKTPSEIAEELECDRAYVRFLLGDMELPYKQEKRRSGKAKYHWDVLEPEDWEKLSDLQIQELLGVKSVSVVTQRRSPDRGDMPLADRDFVDEDEGKYFQEVKERIAPILAERRKAKSKEKISVKAKKRKNKRGSSSKKHIREHA